MGTGGGAAGAEGEENKMLMKRIIKAVAEMGAVQGNRDERAI